MSSDEGNDNTVHVGPSADAITPGTKVRPSRKVFYAYRVLARFAEVLPASGVVPLARLAARIGVWRSPARAALIRRNLTHVLGHEPTAAQVQATFASYIRYWLEALRLPVVPRAHLDAIVECDGLEHLLEARAAGRGLVLALPHMGNWDVAGAWLVNKGIPLTVVVERLEPPELYTWFRDFRLALGFEVVVNSPTVGAELISALRRGNAIALLCDRDLDGTGGSYEFFDEVTTLPKGPATLALRTGAALLPTAVYDAPRGHRIVVKPSLSLEREGRLGVDVDRITQQLAHQLEDLIRVAPEQWHLFQPNWPSEKS